MMGDSYMKKRIRNWFTLTVKKRLIGALLLFLIVPSITVGWLSYQKAADQVKMEIIRSAQAKTEMLSLQINQMLDMEKDNGADGTRVLLQTILLINPLHCKGRWIGCLRIIRNWVYSPQVRKMATG